MQTKTDTMRAFLISRRGEKGSVQTVAVPAPRDGELLVRVRAAGVNPYDWKVRDGVIPSDVFPVELGVDFAGTVESAGARVSGFAPGDRVFGTSESGSFAEYATVDASAVIAKIPQGLSDVQAAALPVAGLTALSLVHGAGAGPGTTVLVVGAAGGVGSYAVQLARQRGARVIGVAHSSDADAVRALGASAVIAYDRGDVPAAVEAAVPSGVDAVIDLVSNGPAVKEFARVIRAGGRIVSPIAAIDEAWFAERKIDGRNIGMAQAPAPAANSLLQLARMVVDGTLKVNVGGERPLDETGQALDDLKAGRITGKLVIRI
jgi:NADPH:quinone reductase-like Zn-dependent oxidoreductase